MDVTEFCGEVFLDYENQVYNTTNPTFSNCFQQLVFTLTPCGFLWILALPYYLTTCKKKAYRISMSALFKAKMVTTFLLWVFAWADLIKSLADWGQSLPVPTVNLVTPLLLGISMALALVLTQYDRMKGIRSSGLLTTYWFFFLLSWIFVFKGIVDRIVASQSESINPLSSTEILRSVMFFWSYVGIIVNCFLCFFADRAPEFPEISRNEEDSSLTHAGGKIIHHPPSPEDGATFISKMSFWWFTGMTVTGYKKPLEDHHLWLLNKTNTSARVTKQFVENWNKELAKSNKYRNESSSSSATFDLKKDSSTSKEEEILIVQPKRGRKKGASLFIALVKSFGPSFLISSLLKVLQDILAFVSPQLLGGLITFMSLDLPLWHGYFLAVCMFVVALLQSIILQQYFHICFVVGMRLRSAIISAIYKKALVLSNSSRKQSTVGEIVNLMSVDAQRFMDLMSYLNVIWSGPFQIILALYFLWQVLGPSILAGLAVMILLIPINSVFAAKARALQVKQMRFKDDRIKLMNEIFNGIKVLKMYAWEMSFKDKVSEIREKEIRELRHAAYLNAVSMFTFVCAPFMVSVTTFAVYVLSDPTNILDARKAFVSLSLFNLLRFPLAMLPMVVTSLVQASVSLQRLQAFLNNDELDVKNVERGPTPARDENAIVIENSSFKWDSNEGNVLSDISMSIREGSLVAVVGQVGSGKSSLMSALLGDMDKSEGRVAVKGSVAYVPQIPWIQNLTVRENITFGKLLDACQYQDITKACELAQDFEMLPDGDHTEIGERGINLSGGQKQRVSIARAVYQNADIYLFDDPLSAVDAHVGKNIFDHVIGPDGCLKTKTRILVTHGLAFLPHVDQIFVLVRGRITEVGTYNQLLTKNEAFAEFLRTYAQMEDEDLEGDPTVMNVDPESFSLSEDDLEPEMELEKVSTQGAQHLFAKKQTKARMHGPVCKYVPLKKKQEAERVCHLPPPKSLQKLIQTEKAETGNVKLSVFLTYMRAIGFFLSFVVILFYVLQNVAQVYSNIWLSEWSTDLLNPDGTRNGTEIRLGVYGALGIGQALFNLLSTITLYFAGIGASKLLHYEMLSHVLRAPMSFFDQTPIGRIISRCSKDTDVMDTLLIMTISMFLSSFLRVASTLFVISFVTPLFLAALIPILLVYVAVQRFYVRTSRQLKRLESVSRSPIYSHFGETVTGVSTIRAYSLQQNFIKQNELKVDINQMSYYPNIVSNRWLAIRLELAGNFIVLFAAIFAVARKGSIDPGIVGLSVSYAMQVTQTLNWLVRQSSELETNIVAVERIQEYTKVEQEAPLIEDDRPPDDWPATGGITFERYSTKYREELDLVVKDISFDIKGGEKIGIVGRTGAGKSSLTLALFRIVESVAGKIIIDGKNISKIGLKDLRSKLSIIPQDPVLFSGNLRMNLDPFDKYTDDQLWYALEHSHLKSFVMSLPLKLEHEVMEGGDNLSVGQRQLVCLTRALLRKSKILVLDEATAAVDLETDDLIQATIRSEFKDCTTFTIAHRLNTIMDSTRILVLGAGEVAEFDTPSNLIKAKGVFFEMAKDAGLA